MQAKSNSTSGEASAFAFTDSQALEILRQVRQLLGRNYKSAIREAWMTGNYDAHLLHRWSGELQRIRNTFGPSWLVRARP